MTGKRCVVFAVSLALVAGFSLFAQTADSVTRMLETDAVTYSQAAYFMVAYAGLVPDTASEGEALIYAVNEGFCAMPGTSDAPVTLSQFAGMCMRTFKLRGGLMYTLTKSNHYAFREFQALGLLSSTDDPQFTITGRDALAIITDCLELVPGDAQ